MIGVGGQRAPGLAAAALAGLVAVFAWRFLRESHVPRTGSTDPGIAPTTGHAAIGRVLTRWRDPASRLVWIYAVAIGAFYGTGQTAPILLAERFGITERNVGYFIMYLGGMGVVVRSLVLGPVVDRLGEARLSRLGIVVLALGLALTGLARGYVLLGIGFTLMPFGTAFLFPCVTGLLSRVVPTRERGLYMGVQHTFGGVSRSAFPIAAGFTMDHFGVGVPFWVAGILVLLTLPLTGEMAGYVTAQTTPVTDALAISSADVTGEFPTEPAPGLGRRSKEG
jgi:MFS family permease